MSDPHFDPRFDPTAGGLVPHMGIALIDEGEGWLEAKMPIRQCHLRSGANALHAASMVALADSV